MLLNMVEKFKCALDKGEYVTCISMDISKAFDTVKQYANCKPMGFPGMHVSLLQAICINENKGLKLVKLKVTGKKLIKGCHKVRF